MPLLDAKTGLRRIGSCYIRCAGCGGPSEMEVYRIISRPRVLGVPAGKPRRRYLCVCPGCGGRYRLEPRKGAAMEKRRPVSVFQSDVTPYREVEAR